MKKVAGIVFAVMMVGVLLTGCCQKACDPAPCPVYKGEG